MSILMQVPHCLVYCSFIIYFEIGKLESSNFVVSRLFWLDSGALVYSYEFWDRIVTFCTQKKPAAILKDGIEYVGQFGECCHLYI